MHRVRNVEKAYQLALKAEEKQNQQFVQRNRGARRGTLSPSQGSFNYGRGESLKGLRKSKIVNKIIQINHKEVDFREVEVTMLAEEDLLFVLS